MKKNLTLTNMIYNIVASVFYLVSIPAIFIGAFTSENGASSTAGFFTLVALIGLILAISNLTSDKKQQFRVTSSVLAIIGHGLMLLGAILSLPAMILTILAAIFYGVDLKNKK